MFYDPSYFVGMAVICGILGGLITSSKGRGFFVGLVLGGLLGVIGLVIALFMKTEAPPVPEERKTRECPHCKESMRRDASVCPHCQRDSTPRRFHEGFWWFTDEDGGRTFYLDPAQQEWVLFVATDRVARPRA
jgi:hypothetical protein